METVESKSGNSSSEEVSVDDLVHPHKVWAHLKAATEQNVKTGVTLDNETQQFTSTFLSMSSDDDIDGILIDILSPDEGMDLLDKSRKLKVVYMMDDVHYSFETSYLKKNNIGFGSLKIAIPMIIRNRPESERRKCTRVQPSSSSPLKVGFGDGTVEEITDISTQGLGFYTTKGEDKVGKGELLPFVSFTLPSEKRKLSTKALVNRFVRDLGKVGRNKCGIAFIEMRNEDIDAITKYVSQRRRQIIKGIKAKIYIQNRDSAQP